jgi:hypothetical protein
MKYIYYYTAFSACLFLFSNCKKSALDTTAQRDRIEIFSLKKFQWKADNTCVIDLASVELESSPLISNDDIVSYNSTAFTLELKGNAVQNMKNLTPRTPFAVTVDGKIIYIGVHMPLIMSSVCFESITLHSLSPNLVKLQLGYPGVLNGVTIDDRRNDSRILGTLKKQGKLKP